MDNSTYEIRFSNWKSIIEASENRPQDMTKHQWLIDNGIPEKQYYYWLRKVRRTAFSQLTETSLPVSSRSADISLVKIPPEEILPSTQKLPAVVIRTQKASVELSSDLPKDVLLKIIKAVSHAL